MASAVILTYERKASFGRNGLMKKKGHHGFSVDHGLAAPAERSYTSETMADSSDMRRSRRPSSNLPCTAQNFTTKSTEQDPSETASEDSCSLKRKSMSITVNGRSNAGPSSFNGGGYGGGGGRGAKDPSVSRFNGNSFKDLSRDEKQQLRKRIKMDLQQVRSMSQRVQARELEVRSLLQSSARCAVNGSTTNGHYFSSAAESSMRETARFPAKKPSVIIPETNLESLSAAGKDKRTPKANQLYTSSEFLSGKDKLPPPEKQKSKTLGNNSYNNSHHNNNSSSSSAMKRSFSGKHEDREAKRQKMDFGHSRRLVELMKQCGAILKRLMSHKFGWVFNEPVNVVELGLHDYHKIIKKPMDLGTIKKKLDTGVYLLPTELCEDVRLTFANALKYNPQGHDVYMMAETLRGMFESKWKAIEVKVRELESAIERASDMEACREEVYGLAPPPRDRDQTLAASSSVAPKASMPSKNKPASSVARSSSTTTTNTMATKMKAKPKSSPPPPPPPPPPKREMTFDEKQELSELLGTLPAEKLEQAVQIMRKNPNIMQTDDEIEVDIESFDIDTLWELHQFVKDCSKGKQEEDEEETHVEDGPAAFPDHEVWI
jgi:hypothetical protein